MLNNLRNAFNAMIQERVEEIGSKVLLNHEEYTKVCHECDELYQKIRAILPEEYKSMLFDLDLKTSYLQAIAEDIMYEQGLKDGIELKDILKIAK